MERPQAERPQAPEIAHAHYLDDPCGDGFIRGVRLHDATYWELHHRDGSVTNLGTVEEMKEEIIRLEERNAEIEARLDELVTKHPQLKSVSSNGNGAAAA